VAARAVVIPATVAEYMDDIVAVAGGFIDAFLLRSSVGLFLLKNIAIPIVDKAGWVSLPKGLVYQSEGMLGFVIGILVLPSPRAAAAATPARPATTTAMAVARAR
jgi:hypothetical protein